MKLLQLVTRPQRRGAEIFAVELGRELAPRGHTSRIAALYAPPAGAEPLDLGPGGLALGADPASLLERLPGFQPGLVSELAAAVDETWPDIVQVNGSRPVKYGSLLRRLRPRAPWALVYRSIGTPTDWHRGSLHRLLYRRLVVDRMDGIIAVSEATRESLETAYRPAVPVEVIPRGIDIGRFRPGGDGVPRRQLGTPETARVVLWIGSLSSEKRPERAVRVITAARERLREQAGDSVELWIAGDGPLAARLAEPAARTSVPVHLLGERSDVPKLMADADLLLLTSDTEGTPGVVLEAAASGLPAVAPAVGGVAHCIDNGITGLVVPAGDEAALAAAVAALLADDKLRRRMGIAARRRAEERFALGSVAERCLAFYERVLARRRDER